jgi:MinD superfamily P-loop ATPase
MKQLLILSGKGGTGKTTVASAFIRLSEARAFADCDVDAPNLHLVMEQKTEAEKSDYYGLPKADLNPELCTKCGLCLEHCRFDAIVAGSEYQIDPYACEGCGVCAAICPAEAIAMKPAVAGELILYRDNRKVFSTAQLKMGSGTTGMLVSEVKKQMKEAAGDASFAIIDGSPGIGCPVIASLSGVDLVLIVTEPSISGISDMDRIIKTAATFQTAIAVCINKYNTNLANSVRIEDYCRKNDLLFVGQIPFDPEAVRAVNSGKTIVDIDCPSGRAVKKIFKQMIGLLLADEGGAA